MTTNQGLQIWNANGDLIFDTNLRNGMILGVADIGNSPYSGTITIPAGSGGVNVLWWHCIPLGASGYNYEPLVERSSTTTIYWEATEPCKIIYGTF